MGSCASSVAGGSGLAAARAAAGLLGTDDNAPYRVFPDLEAHRAGSAVELLAVVKDNAGHTSHATVTTTVR